MQEELTQFETAKLAKEKGFDLDTIYNANNYVYDKNGELQTEPYYFNHLSLKELSEQSYDNEEIYLAPTQSLLQKWLREVHKIQIEIEAVWNQEMTEIIGYYYFNYKTWSEKVEIVFKEMKHFDTYEQALEVALLEALNLKMKKYLNEGKTTEMIVTVLNSDKLHSLIVLPNGETIEVLNTELTDINAD